MKFRKYLLYLLVFSFCSMSFLLCGFSFFKKEKSVSETAQQQQVVKNDENLQNNLWCITFQLVWNEFMNKFTNGKPVMFDGGNPKLADELNKKLYTKDDISSDSYYIADGKISHALKKQIEKGIYKKFKEKSDILNMINWNVKDSYLFYAMLKKDFNFLTPFDKLNSVPFNFSKENVKYFGIKDNSSKKLYSNVNVLFYNSDKEYAVKLMTKEREEVILFRTELNDTFENLYAYVKKNTSKDNFMKHDILLVPEIKVDKVISYTELCNKKISGSDYVISQALQTIKFKMDNKGGTLKSEAAIAVMKTALVPESRQSRFFLFDKPFVMFLKEQDKDKPYYAMKIDNTDYLVRE